MTRRHSHFRAAFSLAEAVAAVGLLGVCVVGVLTAASGAVGRAQATQARSAASALVAEILDEASALDYQDPTVTTTTLGFETGEGFTRREQFDDVDDFNGWSEGGIVDRSGAAVKSMSGWRRSVTVEWVDAATASVVSVVETGVKRVTVTITRSGKVLATGSVLATKAWRDATP